LPALYPNFQWLDVALRHAGSCWRGRHHQLGQLLISLHCRVTWGAKSGLGTLRCPFDDVLMPTAQRSEGTGPRTSCAIRGISDRLAYTVELLSGHRVGRECASVVDLRDTLAAPPKAGTDRRIGPGPAGRNTRARPRGHFCLDAPESRPSFHRAKEKSERLGDPVDQMDRTDKDHRQSRNRLSHGNSLKPSLQPVSPSQA